MSFPLVVFDLDGTLVDSRKDLADSVNLMLESYGASRLPDERIIPLIGDGAPVLVARAFEAAGAVQPADAMDRFLGIYDERLLAHTRPYDGIPEALDALQGRAMLGVLTNKPLHGTRAVLEGLGLARYFAPGRVFGGDGPLPRKPQPEALLRLASDAGVPIGRTLLVGDSIVDWKTARNAGAPVCLVRYGFGFATLPPGCPDVQDRVIDAPAELLSL